MLRTGPGPSAGTRTRTQLSPKHTMTPGSDQTLVHELRELIAALDRRVPRIEREGERAIARDAQGLRRAALMRLCELDPLSCDLATGTVAREGV